MHVAKRNAYRILVGEPEERRPLETPRRRWEDIKMDVRETGCGGTYWIHLAPDEDLWTALVYKVMNLLVP
jgi:hypothetical protein